MIPTTRAGQHHAPTNAGKLNTNVRIETHMDFWSSADTAGNAFCANSHGFMSGLVSRRHGATGVPVGGACYSQKEIRVKSG